MPTYDYECSRCGHVFELFQKMTRSPGGYVSCVRRGGSEEDRIGRGTDLQGERILRDRLPEQRLQDQGELGEERRSLDAEA